MKKDYISIIIGVAVVALIVVGIFIAFRQPYFGSPTGGGGVNVGTGPTTGQNVATYTPPKVGIVQPVVPITEQANVVIDITAVGFSPAVVTIKPGQSVIWTNRDRASHWIVPDPTDPYPSNGTCGSALNSCQALALGQSFRFTFSKAGTWGYYDKLNPKFAGEIVVQ